MEVIMPLNNGNTGGGLIAHTCANCLADGGLHSTEKAVTSEGE